MSIYGPSRDLPSTESESDVDLSDYVRKSGARMTGRLNMGNKKIMNLAQPTHELDAANVKYVGAVVTLFGDRKLDKSITSNLEMRGNKITGLGDPSEDYDAVPKKYVDALIDREREVRLRAVGRYIVMPNGGTKSYFSVRAKKKYRSR